MQTRRRAKAWLAVGIMMAAASAPRANAQTASVSSATSSANTQNASTEDYRNHLAALATLTAECAKARDKKSCNPTRVGPDDRLALSPAPNAEKRIIRYAWLRALLEQAQVPDAKPETKPSPTGDETLLPPETTSTLLNEAQKRLTQDAAQASAPAKAAPSHAAENTAMQKVLAQHEFHRLQTINPKESAYEHAMSWLNRIFNGVSRVLEGAAWVGRLLVWGFLMAVGVGLVWALLQLERRWRVKLVSGADGPAPNAASARDWQLWMADAHRAAESGQWREAIHFLYWASISQLESKRLWPADRARTPREYLALVAPEDPRKEGLSALTGSFERIWYGGRAASEADYRHADALATALIAGGRAQ